MDTFITGSDRERIQALLSEGEELLWISKPEVGATHGFPHVIFGLFVVAFGCLPLVVGLEPGAVTWAVILFYSFFGLFILLGLGFLFVAAPLYVRHARQQVYAITNKRAIVLKHNGKLTEYPLAPYMVMEVRRPGKRPGALILGYEERHTKYSTYMEGVGFLHCPEAETALNILQERLNGKALLADKPISEICRERDEADIKNAEPPEFATLVTIMSVPTAIGLGCLSVMLYRAYHEQDIPALAFIGFVLCCFIVIPNIPTLRSALRGRKLRKNNQT